MDVRYKPFQKCIQFLKVFNFSFHLPPHTMHYYVFINFISLLFFNSLGSGVLEFEPKALRIPWSTDHWIALQPGTSSSSCVMAHLLMPTGTASSAFPFLPTILWGRKALVAILLSLGELFLGVFELLLLCREWGAQKNVVYLNFRLQICQVCPSLSILPLWARWVFPFLTLLLILLLLRVRDVCCFNGLLTESRTLEDVGSTNKLLS